MTSIRFALVLASCFALGACSSEPRSQPAGATPQKPYALPAEFFLKPVAERGPEGEIYISGTTNLPDGLKMWVILGPKKAQQDAFVKGGRFRSGALYPKAPAPITGNQALEITALFNGAWQDRGVLSLVGDGGKNLHGSLFKLTDPDVIDSDKMLEVRIRVPLPPVTPETSAINTVKHAVLTVPGMGRSATDIQENLALFTKPGTGVRPGKGWIATLAGPNVYNVSYDFIDGTSEKQAIWSVNTATKQVKYVNESAKLSSWTPKD